MEEVSKDGATYIRRQLDSRMVRGRYSSGLVIELMGCVESGSANIFAILNEIATLEDVSGSQRTRTKEATPFKGPSLSGLWHKHFVQARSIPKNLLNRWGRSGFVGRAKAIMEDQSIPYEGKAESLSRAYVFDGYMERIEAQKITGDFIVYARHQELNYYLTVGTHDESDDMILKRVLICCEEFPHLKHSQIIT